MGTCKTARKAELKRNKLYSNEEKKKRDLFQTTIQAQEIHNTMDKLEYILSSFIVTICDGIIHPATFS